MLVLIVGRSFSGLTDKILENGDEYVVLRDQKTAKSPEKKFKRRVVCDFSSKESVLSTIDSITSRYQFNTVIATYENYILAAAWISEHLGLPGIPVSAAEACTDKELMREAFAKAPEKVSPDFCVVKSEDDIRSFADTHTFPLILKPANLAKSLLVTKNDDMDELLANYRKTLGLIDGIYEKYAAGRTPKLILEEFLTGSIHSVDAFVGGSGEPAVLDSVVDYLTGYDIGFADNFHYARLLPSNLSAEEQAELRHVAAVGCRALGMKNSPAHVEIIMTSEGPRIVEIGARNGGYRERMHQLANGLDIPTIALNIRQGVTSDLTLKKRESCAVLELFPKEPGVFAAIENEDQLKALPSLVYYSVKQSYGQFVGSSSDGYKMCAIIILHNADGEQFSKDLAYVNDNVRVVTN